MAPIELGYWAIRGLGAPARMMLAHSGADHADVRYADASGWFAGKKPVLLERNALANLPYVQDGDVVVSHSTAVYEYLGVKLGYDDFASDGEGRFANAQLLAECYDLRNGLMDVVYPFNGTTRTAEEFETNCEGHIKTKCGRHMQKFASWLEARGTRWLVKDTLSSADFHLWELIDQHEIIAKRKGLPSPLEACPRLQRYYAEFRALPELEKYFQSDAYTLPMNSIAGGAFIF